MESQMPVLTQENKRSHQNEATMVRKKSKKKSQNLEEELVPDESRPSTFDANRWVEGEPEAGLERNKSVTSFEKKNAVFHKLFKSIPSNEDMAECFRCALHREVPYHGKMYISENFVCFYSGILKETKVLIPVTAVAVVKKQNVALLVPNALSVRTTDGEKYLFASFRSRELSFRALKRVCVHLEDGSASSSPMVPSPNTSFSYQRVTESSQSSFERRSQEEEESMKGSMSSDESEGKMTPVAVAGRCRDTAQPPPSGTDTNTTAPPPSGRWWLSAVPKRSQESRTIKTLLLIYVFLVLLLLFSSGYIGWRLVALEEQLMSMGAWPQTHTHSKSKDR